MVLSEQVKNEALTTASIILKQIGQIIDKTDPGSAAHGQIPGLVDSAVQLINAGS